MSQSLSKRGIPKTRLVQGVTDLAENVSLGVIDHADHDGDLPGAQKCDLGPLP